MKDYPHPAAYEQLNRCSDPNQRLEQVIITSGTA